jgi:hypothetical protein
MMEKMELGSQKEEARSGNLYQFPETMGVRGKAALLRCRVCRLTSQRF